MKLASDYSLMPFDRLLELDCISYRQLVRDAFIYKMKQSPDGQEYLEQAYLLKQTNPDRKSLRKQFT